jgi:hypothetical protein
LNNLLKIKPEISKLLKGIVICKETGIYLLDLILDSNINPIMLSSFVGALSLFGSENMGKIEEISIKGLDIQMIIVNKYDLVLITIMDKLFAKDGIRQEAEKALDQFYTLYKNDINECVDINQFESFKRLLYTQIEDYFQRLEKESEIKDFGFFTEAIAKLRNHS